MTKGTIFFGLVAIGAFLLSAAAILLPTACVVLALIGLTCAGAASASFESPNALPEVKGAQI